MAPVTRLAAALVGMTSVALLASCTTDIPTSPTRTVTVTSTEAATPSSATSSSADVEPPRAVADSPDAATSDGDQGAKPCGPRALSPTVINAAIATLTRTGAAWHVNGSNFSTCNDISYVALDTVGTATPAPYQLLIFDKTGTFLGTGIKCDVLYQQVIDSGPDFVEVRYNYDRPGQVMGSQTGAAYATYRWNGTRVAMEGTLPIEVTFRNC